MAKQESNSAPDGPENAPLRLVWLDPDVVADNPANWREHPSEQLEGLAATIAEVGWAAAGLYNERTGRAIDGHLRKKLPRELRVDGKMPYLVGSWSQADERKILATLDPLSAMAAANQKRLDALLAEIEPRTREMEALLAAVAKEHGAAGIRDGLTDPDEVPEPPDEPTTQPGDLWILGKHRLACGDSGNPEHVDRLLDGAEIHLVNCDPPYNVRVEPRSRNAIAAGNSSFWSDPRQSANRTPSAETAAKKMRAKDRRLENDDFASDEDFEQMLLAWFSQIARVLQPGRAFYIWGGYANCANYPLVLKACGLYFSQSIIWDKEHPVLSRKDFMGAHEWCFYGWREGAAHVFLGPNNATDLWHVKKINPTQMVHLTEKPVELAVRAIQYSSRPGENVLDLFGGSGSTLIGAEQTGRRGFLMEIDPAYSDVILQRWEQFTGNKAIRRT